MALGPDSAAVPMHDALNRGQPDARAFECLRRVQALEYAEQLIYIFHVEADAIIANEDHHLICRSAPRIRFRFRPAARVRVNFTALEIRLTSTSRSMERSPYNAGSAPNFPDDVASFGFLPDFAQSFLHKLFQADHVLVRFGAADSRKGQKIVDQVSHPLGRFQNDPDISLALFIETEAAFFCRSSVNPDMWRSGARRSCEME